MKPLQNAVRYPLAAQIQNNTTSFVGHLPGDDKTISRGQTFIAHEEGDVDAIEIYSNIVARPGHVVMTLHNFDPSSHAWGQSLGSSIVEVGYDDSEKWIGFHMPHIHLQKGRCYGFKIESNDSLIGIGEAASTANDPSLAEGQEWLFTDESRQGDSFNYFNLAFKAGARA